MTLIYKKEPLSAALFLLFTLFIVNGIISIRINLLSNFKLEVLRHHTNEVKELVIEIGRLSTENKEMCEYIKELEKKLAEEKSKTNAVKIKKYLGFIPTLVFIFQIISFFYLRFVFILTINDSIIKSVEFFEWEA